MRVGLNLLYLRPGAVGGSEVYCRELARHLTAEPDVDVTLFCGAAAAPTFAPSPRLRVVRVSDRPFSQAGRLLDENLTLARALRHAPVDVLLSPANFAAPLLPTRVPQVATVHDLQHLWFPQHFSARQRVARNALFAATFLRARRLIAISDFTARDLAARYRVPPRKVRTVLEGIDRAAQPVLEQLDEVRRAYGLDRPFLYYPAATTPHKDHLGLLGAFARLLAQHPDTDAELVLSGQRTPHWAAIEGRIAALGLAGRVRHLGFVPRAHVFPLMKLARALVFPSTFEGFGLPLLEAMQVDTPVLAARCGAIPEVVGAGADLLAPAHTPSGARAWADAMHRALVDAPFRARLAQAGRANLDRFSWTRCARETLDVLREVAR